MIPFAAFLNAARLASDAQRVIWLRMLRLAACDAQAATEAYGMVTEKVAAMAASQAAATLALSRGLRPDLVAHQALAPYRKRVRKNLTRLSR